MSEEWKNIPYTEGKYQASSSGKIRRVHKAVSPTLLAGGVINKGYRVHTIFYKGRRRTALTHRLVYETFVGPIPPDLQMNHKDGRKLNNSIDNLEAVSQSENMKHAWRTGLIPPKDPKYYPNPPCLKGEENPRSKLTNGAVLEIRKRHIPGIFGYKRLADEYSVSKHTIWAIINRKAWVHI